MASDTAAATTTAPPAAPSNARWYVLGVLLVIYISNFADRQILTAAAVQNGMKRELLLEDWQLGVLGGIAFGVFYAVMGVPIARLAEKYNRVRLISIAVVAWSVATALCGAAQNFVQLFLARFGVGVGEAGSGPASNSLIADYFPPERRATAISIFSLGVPIGALLGAIGGAWVATTWGWREAFFVVGLPGIALAVLAWMTIKEPIRGALDGRAGESADVPSLMEVVRRLAANRTLVHLGIGTAVATFVNYGVSNFAQALLYRGYGLTEFHAALAYGIIGCLAAVVGIVSGGWLTDRYGKKDERWRVWIPGIGLALAGPMYALGFSQNTILGLSILVIPPIVLQFLYTGPTFAILHNMVAPRMRATAVAVVNLIINLIGMGLGPTVVGGLSSLFGRMLYRGPGEFATTCPAGLPPEGASAALQAACTAGSFEGLRWSFIVVSMLFVWAAVHFFLASRHLRDDLPKVPRPADQL